MSLAFPIGNTSLMQSTQPEKESEDGISDDYELPDIRDELRTND